VRVTQRILDGERVKVEVDPDHRAAFVQRRAQRLQRQINGNVALQCSLDDPNHHPLTLSPTHPRAWRVPASLLLFSVNPAFLPNKWRVLAI
jgi:hypothetical protein